VLISDGHTSTKTVKTTDTSRLSTTSIITSTIPETTSISTSTLSSTTTIKQAKLILTTYDHQIENSQLIYQGHIKISGKYKNIGDAPAYKINVYCKVYDEYDAKIIEGSLCFLGCDLNLYPEEEKPFDFSIPTDNPSHVKKVTCEPT